MMDLMDDDDLKKSVIDQMMGELDDVTSDSLKKPAESPAKGVEITISVSPKTDEETKEDMSEEPSAEETPESSNYIEELKKKLGL